MIDERQDGDTSITCSINVAQTDNKVLEAGSPREKRYLTYAISRNREVRITPILDKNFCWSHPLHQKFPHIRK